MSYSNPSLTASGTTFAQWQAGGLAGHIENLIAAQAATIAPTVAATISLTGGGQSIVNPTVAATAVATGGGRTLANPSVQATVVVGSGSTGSLAAGTYYVAYTFYTPTGETTIGTGASNQFTVSAGNDPVVTLPNLPTGATGMNLYLSNTNGLATAVSLYAKGITQATAATVRLDSSLWFGQTFANATVSPATNTCTGGVPTAATGNYFGYTWVHAHGETTLGTSVSTLTAIAAGNVPQITIPALPTGALSANIYMSNTNGVNTALVLYATGVTTTTYNVYASTWNGGTFAAGKSPPTSNTTVGALAPGVYYTNFTESNGIGETLASAESSTFTVTSQSVPTAQATGVGSSSGSTLPAGAYYAAYSWVDVNGNETTLGSANATESAAITTTGTQILTITFNDTLPGWAVGRNVYLTAAGGATGSETLYATNVSTATYVASVPLWLNNTIAQSAARTIPLVNGTSVDIPRVTFPSLQTGNTARNLYLTAAGGAAGSEVLYATGITTTTFDCAIAAPSNSYAVKLPAENTTSLYYTDANSAVVNRALNLLRSGETGNLQDLYQYHRTQLQDFNSGNPVKFSAAITKLRHAHVAFAAMAQVCSEAGVLMDANPGTLKSTTTTIGNPRPYRSWP